jgi:DNA-binding CsgD family transcriptional regulator
VNGPQPGPSEAAIVAARQYNGPTVGLNVTDVSRRRQLSDQLSRLGALVVSASAFADIIIVERGEDRFDQPRIVLGGDAMAMSAGDHGDYVDLPFAIVSFEPSDDELALALNALRQGMCLIPRKLVGDLFERALEPALLNQGEDEPDDARLSGREREVLAILVDGGSNKDIARSLDVSIHTAKFHVASLREKLQARGRAELVAIALRRGLVVL